MKVGSKKDVIDDVGHDDGNNKGICNAWYRQIVAVFCRKQQQEQNHQNWK